MRDLTEAENAAIEAFGEAINLAAALPEVHPSDCDELVFHVHACQNIILARPGYEVNKRTWYNKGT